MSPVLSAGVLGYKVWTGCVVGRGGRIVVCSCGEEHRSVKLCGCLISLAPTPQCSCTDSSCCLCQLLMPVFPPFPHSRHSRFSANSACSPFPHFRHPHFRHARISAMPACPPFPHSKNSTHALTMQSQRNDDVTMVHRQCINDNATASQRQGMPMQQYGSHNRRNALYISLMYHVFHDMSHSADFSCLMTFHLFACVHGIAHSTHVCCCHAISHGFHDIALSEHVSCRIAICQIGCCSGRPQVENRPPE